LRSGLRENKLIRRTSSTSCLARKNWRRPRTRRYQPVPSRRGALIARAILCFCWQGDTTCRPERRHRKGVSSYWRSRAGYMTRGAHLLDAGTDLVLIQDCWAIARSRRLVATRTSASLAAGHQSARPPTH
jgi:hypothetical protein